MKEQSKRLGEDSIPSLMARLSIPAFIGMFVMGCIILLIRFSCHMALGHQGLQHFQLRSQFK